MYRLVLAVLMTVLTMSSITYVVYVEALYPDDPAWIRFIIGWLSGAFAGGMTGALVMRDADRTVAITTGVSFVVVGIPCMLAAGVPKWAAALSLWTTFQLVGLGQRTMVRLAGIGVRS